ncbi:MAG: DUF928 domain-containing protein [Oscillatoria sp. SIO1A7]|nr:DUF928 domain-containing protein [Oscillatoria sp. SIO1A7]
MSWKNLMPSKKMLALMLAPGMLFVSTLSMQRSALSLSFETPGSDVGQPRSSIGGGVRGTACEIDPEEEIKGLMPSQNIGAVGRTISKTPTLFWYVPENQAEIGEITIVDEARKEVYSAEFALPSKSGIIKYEIPESVELEEGKKYEWLMALVCDPDDRAADGFTRGHMLVVEESEDLEEELAKATNALEKATAYNKAQVWHDTLSSLAEVADEYPEEWTELLESVGLGAIATVDVLDCCTIEN